MQIRLLGPVDVKLNGRSVKLGGPKQRAVLAMLALNANATVSRGRLIDALWGEEPPPTGAKMIQQYVSQLRRLLPDDGATRILTRGRGYELQVDPVAVDALRFERLVGLAADGSGDYGELALEALALWQGAPLAGMLEEPFAAAEVRRLEELHLAATELALEADLDAGRYGEAIGRLRALVDEHPLRERVRALLMLALYRAGRQAEALDVFRDARYTLVETLGLDPGPELRRLQEAILRQDPTLDRGVPDEAWASRETAQRLDTGAGLASRQRAELRELEQQLAADVVDMHTLRGRTAQSGRAQAACPFKGLAPFDVGDAELFFGRERLVAELVARLPGTSLLGAIGPSGSGKSSAVHAGLLPALATGVLPGSERWTRVLVRPGEQPGAALAGALGGVPLPAAVGRLEPGTRLLVVVDQFEEVFTVCTEQAERAAFLDELASAAAADTDGRLLVVLALRADFYGACASHPQLARLLGANQVLVGPMRPNELGRAIEEPAAAAGLVVEPELAARLVEETAGRTGGLPLLSTTLLELWERRSGDRLTIRAYERTGGVNGAVARLAERAYDRLSPTEAAVARNMLVRLAGAGEAEVAVKRQVPLAELDLSSDAAARRVLDVLTANRLVTVGGDTVEVAHEALLREWPRLRGWLEQDAEARRLHRHITLAAREWEAGGRDPGELYRGARLAAATEWSAVHRAKLNARERAFLDAGRAANERSQRRLRAMLAGVAVLLVLSVIAGVIAFEQRGSAREHAVAADAQRLGARALVEDDLDRALLLARQGVALDNSAQTRGNLLAALLKSPATQGILRGDDEPIAAIALSRNDRTLAAGTNTNKIFLFDTRTRRRLVTLVVDPGAFVNALAFSPDGRRLAVSYDLGGAVVVVFDLRSRRHLARLSPAAPGILSGLRYSPDGRELEVILAQAFGSRGPAMFMRLDASTGATRFGPVPVNQAGTTSLMITSDGRRLVTVGEGETVVRDARTMRPLRRWPVGGRGVSQYWPTALAPDDRTVAIGGEDGSVRFVDLETGQQREGLGRHVAEVFGARFTPDGRRLVTTSADGGVIIWDARRATAGETLFGQPGRVLTPTITRDGSTLYTAGPGAAVFIWDLVGSRGLGRPFSTGAPSAQPGLAAVVPGQPFLAVSSDGGLIARGQDDGTVSIIDGHTLARRRPFRVVTTGPVHGLGFVPHSSHLVVTGPDGFLALADADRGRVLKRVPGHRGNVLAPAISADGRLLVTGSDDRTVDLWSLPDMRPIGGPLRFDSTIEDVQVSPDGRWLTIVLVDLDGESATLEVWDAGDRRRIADLDVADDPTAVRISPDGRRLAVGYPNGRSQLWSTVNWEPVTRLLGGDVGDIYALAISPDGRTLATGSLDRTVRLWDIESQQAIGTPLPGPGRGVGAVAPYFTPDGAALIASYDTGRAYRWDIRLGALAGHACRVAGRNLTRAEWTEFLPDRDYDPAC